MQPDRRLDEMVAADVVEVHVDPLGRGLGEGRSHRSPAVVEGGIEAELVKPLDLGGGARAARDAAARDLRHLPRRAPHRPGRSRHEDRLAGLRLSELEEPVAGQARHAEHAEEARHGGDPGVDLAHARAVGEGPLAPAEAVDDPVALGVAVVPRDLDAPTAPPAIGSPSVKGATYERTSFMRGRMYGSTR